ncbi:MAG: NADH:ubiquinone reductase (Na(+)-transporting) subunit D [Candidatus Marinimicrobia bacterium]|jgi:Na+-transporting NADH:ubiquinone oxidoreductase subunit D|nr:NADH:ubiquinone reductase (Na(+)-transporting) subunit D [Candidatus Neomarinimicrobiota bacterium]MBT3575360.1 NADH:ubiquinone reductase (Na(+)-transporting) subunit D [Candidatus Neomarinimicrobiota bacterium]MBT3680725.1 NADH:ubiquinone reductase (Na(+)-transporting) subunit D [Candidatus Neomarinimicrobiota bacterium]MBT3950131.1 NADH:ubiquinone reductase (Na(+)-transporting) subunit D [Candidatus Neomarinimicrobiota bacterium]MBT4253791.1 NADH:ubiquinone reductase (Na(+)-transporting) s
MSLLSKKNMVFLKDPLMDNNPISTQVLGICSALAVTVQLQTAIVMSIAVISVISLSNVLISLIRNMVPSNIRIIIELAIIASLVILVDQVLKAFLYDISKQLSVFVGLIITNCIVLGRAEAFALQNKPWPSFLDGVGNGLGYSMILIVVAFGRELLGSGTLFGFQVIPDAAYAAGYQNMGLMVLAPGAFILLGLIIWVQRTITGTVAE